MNIDDAVVALRQGKRVHKESWGPDFYLQFRSADPNDLGIYVVRNGEHIGNLWHRPEVILFAQDWVAEPMKAEQGEMK